MALKQLGAENIDGTTNLVDTPIEVFQAAGQVLMSNISVVNGNSTDATGVYLWVCANGASPVNANRILPGITLGGKLTVEMMGHALENSGKVYFQSGVTNVNCVVSGDET